MVKQTKMLYMDDNYIKSFTAKVTDKGEDYLVLDQTAFYPLGGGQESDKGTLTYKDSTYKVKIVRKESGKVKHYIENAADLPPVGAELSCEIDWTRRHLHMRYHTAIHILSSYMLEAYQAEVVGNNISTRSGRADFNLKDALTEADLKKIEAEVNKIIQQNLDVRIVFMPREKAKKFLEEKGYQTSYIDMVPSSVKKFRLISVGDYDHASCAGTHIANTKEIGHLKVVKRRSMGVGKERIVLSLDDS